ncbi:MAG TPA: glycosyltransferase family 9 protein [Ktedonobacterales bacterium]
MAVLPKRGITGVAAEPKNILVGMLLPIGDTLLATPALAVLRRIYPNATITVLVSRSNAGILKDNKSYDRLLFAPEKGPELAALRFVRTLRLLWRERFDLVLTLSPISSVVLALAGAYHKPLRLDMPPLWWLVGTHDPEYRARHAADHYIRALAPILDRPLTDNERRPILRLTTDDRQSARALLREWDVTRNTPMITMHVGGKGFNGRKRWMPERFAEVANRLIDRFDAQVVLIGGAEDIARSQQVASLIPRNVTDATGKTTLKESSALIETSTLFIGNDSCPLHIAAIMGTPSVGIFGPSNHIEFTPIGTTSHRQKIIHSTIQCSPCMHFIGNDPPWLPNLCYSYACLKAISSEQVVQAAVDLLQERETAPIS